jgi:uncharacterized membrane protein YeaQ/YmgE (transglycosylase-associated protein family)
MWRVYATLVQNSFMVHTLLLAAGGFFTKDLLVTLVIGLIAGLLAQLVTPGRGYGIFTSIALGVLGGWLGNRFFTFINLNTDIPYLNDVLRAALGAVILVIILNLIVGPDKKDKTRWKSV